MLFVFIEFYFIYNQYVLWHKRAETIRFKRQKFMKIWKNVREIKLLEEFVSQKKDFQ